MYSKIVRGRDKDLIRRMSRTVQFQFGTDIVVFLEQLYDRRPHWYRGSGIRVANDIHPVFGATIPKIKVIE